MLEFLHFTCSYVEISSKPWLQWLPPSIAVPPWTRQWPSGLPHIAALIVPVQNTLDRTSSRMIEKSVLRTKPWWTPSPLPNSSLYPTATFTSSIPINEPRHKIYTCMDPGIFAGGRGGGGPGATARKQLWRFLVFFLVLNLFYSFTEGVQWLFKRKLY